MVRTPERLRLAALEAERAGRRFGLTVGSAFAVLAALSLVRGHGVAALVLAAPAGVLIAGALAAPGRLGPVERAWMRLAHAISRVTTPLVLAAVYFLVLAPLGLARRIVSGNPLAHRAMNGSYWVRRERPRSDLDRQF